MSRSPRGITTGGYFFKVVIVIKFKKFLVILLALISVIALSILPASAATDYLTVDEVISKYSINYDKSTYPYYVLIKYNSSSKPEQYFLIVSNSIGAVYIKNGLAFADYGITFNCRTYTDGTILCNQVNNTSNSSFGRLTETEFISSNYDVKYDGNDTVFFQQTTLLNQLLNLVPQGVGEKVTADMATLTVFGIGLIALLAGLYLVPKVLHKFQI